MDFLQTLLSERDRLQETLKAINILINTYGTNERELVIKNDINASKISDESVFPVKARKDKQILWLFNNVIDKSLKISEVNEIYQKYSGNVDKVNNVARRLKESDKLKVVKYNKSNTLSFWGLPSWIEESDFKEQFRPNADSLPNDVEISEIT